MQAFVRLQKIFVFLMLTMKGWLVRLVGWPLVANSVTESS